MKEEYEEIDLIELVKYILSNWWVLLLLTLIAGGISYYYTTEKIVPIYKASATLFIGKESNSIGNISLGDLQMGNQLISDYSQLIRTNLVTEKVIEDLALYAPPGQLKAYMGVEIIDNSRFMRITYTDPDPRVATEIANKLADILTEKAVQIVGVKNIQIVDYAKVPRGPISPNIRKNVIIASVLGFVLALFVVFLRMLLNNTIQKEEDVEREISLPVLGVIPKFKGEVRI